MKITKEQLKQIIKEELDAVMESDVHYGFNKETDWEIIDAAEADNIEDFIEDMRIQQNDPEWGEYDPEYVQAAYEWGKSQKKTEPE